MSFDDLGLSPKVLAAVKAAGYETPTPIQQQAIPHVLAGRDVLGIAQTGTGKTAGFTLPMLTRLEKGRARARMPRSLILEPTRELAAQVEQSFEVYGANHKLTVALLIGGVSFDEQNRKLDRGADVLIATPGRLLDHFERGKLLLTGVEILVVDEADRMLDMGFIPDIERIVKLTPFTRQTLFFSATMPPEIQRLTSTFLSNPAEVKVAAPSTTADTVKQMVAFAPADFTAKRARLRDILRAEDVTNAIIFCNRKKDVQIVHKSLKSHGFDVAELHGDMDQHARTATLEAFRNGEVTYLIASDVAARGLDIPEVTHIFSFDVSFNPEDYVHRIGRTGRAGRAGRAITLVTPAERGSLEAIEALTKQTLEWWDEAPSEEDWARRESRRGRGGSSRGGSGRSGSGRGRGGREKARKPASSESKREKSEPKSESGSDQPAAKTAKEKPRRTRRSKPAPAKKPAAKRETGGGLGDHVPAFLKRPVQVD